ncbi:MULTISPECIES: RNA-guided endonuclease InsQ/TnpB family protein [Bacillus]|uniref:Transposase n=8 Tax=Bacillus TaxID=1386 RepID=A0A9X6KD51_BACTU|nr:MULTISPECIES: RNA-guided endonuclease TnpB family protein [Bacillus cereus group]NIE91554.1 IS200/IS605 family element transposase accessory protein TnpB [Bacillus sp. Ab-1751]AGE81207.1 Transposase, IS605 [Bacillus thuringiensis serovar kurstaki str. HD73]AHZ54143.1 IS605 family transposase [Bacillus thuringiensis serovar kurstaki str. YBT-1520]AIE36532.1 IS605 family transposase [Bacillus thuringiensis serovar kurstaki str. HD-1]AIM29018.1 Transposase, IS605 [Bacillus thuringiensis serova
MILAKKVRLIPTPEQEQVLRNHAGAARFAYNYCKRMSDRYYKLFGKSVSQLALQKRFTKIKKRKRYEWLKDINAQVPKQASKDFDTARKHSFKKYKNGYHTSYKSKKDLIQGFYANYERLVIGKKVVHIQSIGEVKTSQQLPRNKKPSNPRVTFDGRHWWISVGFQEDFESQELTNESIGVDVGLKELFVASNGMKERNINKDAKVKKLLKRKKSAQRDMSRRFKKGVKIQSAGYEKAKAEHLRLSRKIMNIRNNHIHQATAKLVKTKPMRIVVEDLSISNLLKNKKLSKALSFQKLNFFFQCLSYKCEKYGIAYEKADKWFASSKICSCCGVKYDHSVQPEGQWSIKIREWCCVSCNSHHDRDLNAAINLSRWVK